jgi:hypothetical protein
VAKPKKSVRTPGVLDVQFQIQIPLDGTNNVPAGNINASGQGSPTGSAVAGSLTDTTTGNTIQCLPSTIGADGVNLTTWNLTFQNVPPGSYVLAVQQTDPSLTGADAVNITVVPVQPIVITNNPAPGSTTTVSGNCDPNTVVAGVVSSSRPKHGNPRTQSGSKTFTIKFTGVSAGAQITVYALTTAAAGVTRQV